MLIPPPGTTRRHGPQPRGILPLLMLLCCMLPGVPALAQPLPLSQAMAPGEAGDAGAMAAAVPPAPAASIEPTPVVLADKPAEVRVGDTVVLSLRAEHAGRSAPLRARSANDALHDVLDAGDDDVRVDHAGGTAVIYVGGQQVIQLIPIDAELAGDPSLAIYADRIVARIRAALKTERTRSAVAGGIFGISLAVLFAVIAIFLLRRAWELADRAAAWLQARPEQVPALRLLSSELAGRDTVRSALALGVAFGRWIALLGLLYAWLIATFSLFESTRGVTEQLAGAVLNPLATLASRVAAAVPLLVILVFALLVLVLLLRVVRLFFREVARGATVVGWLPRDLAAPIGTLAEIALILLALVLVAPVITGNVEGAAPRIGLLGLAALALATVPLGATAVVGLATLFGRWLAPGDWIEMGPRSGRVLHLGLLETRLRDGDGVELRIPHLARLLHPVRVHGRTPRISIALPVERRLATPALAERLAQALAPLGSDVVVQLVEVGDTRATLELTLGSTEADARSACLWAALEALEVYRRESAEP